jgi:hypothetical protein
MWFDILKIRKPGPEAREGARLRNEFEFSIDPVPDFSFKGTYTYDELANLIDSDIMNKLERLLKKGRNLLSQEYRLLVASTREKRDFAQSGKMPDPFTMEDIKDKIVIKFVNDPIGKQEPSYKYSDRQILITLPVSKRTQFDDSERALGSAIDKLYRKFVNNNKQKKSLKWYQEYRRGAPMQSVWETTSFRRPDFDSPDDDIEWFKNAILGHVFTDLSVEQLRSGADPLDPKFIPKNQE